MDFKVKKIIAMIIGVIGLVFLDQWTKYLTLINLSIEGQNGARGFFEFFSNPPTSNGEYVPVIDKIFEFTLVYNKGMAWGMFQGMQWLFIIVSIIVVVILMILYMRTGEYKESWLIRCGFILLISGAIGNLIDRVARGEFMHGQVVDMIYFKPINFPVFNVADSCVTIGVVVLLIAILFAKEESFGFKKLEKEGMSSKDENKE